MNMENTSSISAKHDDKSIELVETKSKEQVFNTDSTANHVVEKQNSAIDTIVKTSQCPFKVNEINSIHQQKGVQLKNLLDDTTTIDRLFQKSKTAIRCDDKKCTGSIMLKPSKKVKTQEEILEEAIDFINQFYESVKREGSKQHKDREAEIIESINNTGTYELKETELNFGARMAWRNASKCIGRIQWSKLQVFDARHVKTTREMFEFLCNHIKYAFNKGTIRSTITVFRQQMAGIGDFRVWNPQFLAYAGFRNEDQTIIGDRSQLEFTEVCMKLGWKPKRLEYEFLPLVLQANGEEPEIFEIPDDLRFEVNFIHPKFEWFSELNMKWYCIPGVSNMSFDVGGIVFTACPFNGWYMQTEIARDLADINRYNKLPIIAERMGLDTKNNSSLWKDRALLELNYSIIHSFQKSNITITDHHSASASFMQHYENENKLRGGCPSDWVWLVPPMSGHMSPLFHLEMLNYSLKPSYEYQVPAWKSLRNQVKGLQRKKRRNSFHSIAKMIELSAIMMKKAISKRTKCTILYATETGKSERFSRSLADIFNHGFHSRVICMKDYDFANLEHESLLLIVTSTFGNGDAPDNGEEFKKFLKQMKKKAMVHEQSDNDLIEKKMIQNSIFMHNIHFSVFGLGNSSYPKFCNFAKFVDKVLNESGAECIHELGLGDELSGQEDAFREWSVSTFKKALEIFCIDIDNSFIQSISDEFAWNSKNTRLINYSSKQNVSSCQSLSKLHSRNVLSCVLKNKKNLTCESGRVTLCVEIDTNGYSGELQYKPGDHIGIFANNRKELVNKILSRIRDETSIDQLVKIEILKENSNSSDQTWTIDERYPPCTLKVALTNYIDIMSIPSQKILKYFSTQTSDNFEKEILENLAKEPLKYDKWRQKGNNLVEVLEEFPSLRPSASLLLTQLPKLQPRFYSVSSSPNVIANDIHITLNVVEYKPENKATRYGVCSKWLEEMALDEQIPIFVRGSAAFHLPEDKNCPIIMIGAGTGIAPFRSFWQEKKYEKEVMTLSVGSKHINLAEMYLYFGCRRKNVDELYKDEILEMVNEKVITSYHPAFSREPDMKKTYVQDVIKVNGKQIYELITNKNGHIYICGDVRMAADVTLTLEGILQENSNMTSNDAKEYIDEMIENLRFHEDIFGNTSSKF